MSSPKRYLWDVDPVPTPWEFQPSDYTVDKLPPFGPDEGMSFGRQTHEYHRDDPQMIEARSKKAKGKALVGAPSQGTAPAGPPQKES